jgi:phytoene dehydrogenase-like protein
MPSYDYVVVGAGHNGLCAGATLAEQGRSVCVVERLPVLGGLSASHAYIGDAPDHLLSLGAMDDMFMAQTTLAEDMRLADHGYRTVPLEHPYGWMDEDGETLLLFRDFDRTLADIRHFSPRDARTYAELRGPIDWIMDLVDELTVRHPASISKRLLLKHVLRHRPDRATRRLVGRMLSANVFELISETFESDAMRGLWAYWCSMVGPADIDGGGVYLVGFAGVHRGRGVLRPRGGMTNLVEAFAGVLRSHGGEILVGTGVEQIVVEGGRATGVLLEDGRRIDARHGVIANPAPQVTLGRLVPPEARDRELDNRVRMIPSNSINAAAFKIDIAAAGRVGYPRAEARRAARDGADIRTTTFMTGTLEDHIDQLHAMKRGENVAGPPPVYMAILSAADRTIAGGDGDVVYLHSNVPAHPNGGWPASKGAYAEAIMGSVARFMGGLETEIGRMVSTPRDFEDRFAAPRGAYFHVDMLPTRMGMNRPARGLGGYATPIDRLFLGGAGTHPAGGVTGWPGRLAARHALRTEPPRPPAPPRPAR